MTPSDVKCAKKKYAPTSELLSTNEKNSLSISGQIMLAREKYYNYKNTYVGGNIAELKQVYSATLKYNSKPEIIWNICDNHIER